MPAPTFYYDFNSPYAYLAAHRVDDVLPVRPAWKRRLRECEDAVAALDR
jgi:2-hydroxychromene-2-carboxylate isomerase